MCLLCNVPLLGFRCSGSQVLPRKNLGVSRCLPPHLLFSFFLLPRRGRTQGSLCAGVRRGLASCPGPLAPERGGLFIHR